MKPHLTYQCDPIAAFELYQRNFTYDGKTLPKIWGAWMPRNGPRKSVIYHNPLEIFDESLRPKGATGPGLEARFEREFREHPKSPCWYKYLKQDVSLSFAAHYNPKDINQIMKRLMKVTRLNDIIPQMLPLALDKPHALNPKPLNIELDVYREDPHVFPQKDVEATLKFHWLIERDGSIVYGGSSGEGNAKVQEELRKPIEGA